MFFLGICIHLCFLFSIFDIYFKSPIVKNVNPYKPQHEAVADRLVLFIIDGLRAESFVNYTTMSYLRSIANSHGRWGISHTRVPTESRPGHVAVIAGFYEDPSAIAKGWKANPVDFDSVFNQAIHTWCWGTYDIIEIFTKGNVDDHIYVKTIDPYNKTFSTDKNTTLLDEWVFKNVEKFFFVAKNNTILHKKLRKKKIAFFLHLLGTDTSGHTHKPKTHNYLTTIKYVDEGIKKIEEIIRDFYDKDGRTTFLVTSDHGMTDWGSHGAGDDHETQTPYVIWGAGVQQASQGRIDPSTNKMSLDHRIDLNQADLTPLMATILSIPVPVNSIGQLKSELLNLTLADKAKAIYSNSRQLAHQYDKKRSDMEANAISFLHQPYQLFTKKKYEEMMTYTEELLAKKEYDKLILFSEEIMILSLNGLTYYHNYYQRSLLVLVTLSFMGWIVYLLRILLEQKMDTHAETSSWKKPIIVNKYNILVTLFFLFLFVFSAFVVYTQDLPVQYYIYFLLPVYLWWHALYGINIWLKVFEQLRNSRQVYTMWISILCYFMGSIALGLSFTYRWMLSIPLSGMGLWPFTSCPNQKWPVPLLIIWVLGCGLLSLFSCMPVVGKEVFIELVILAGLIWLIAAGTYLWQVLLPLYRGALEKRKQIILSVIQMALLVLSLHNISTQCRRFHLGTPVSYTDQAMAWIVAAGTYLWKLLLPLYRGALEKRRQIVLTVIQMALLVLSLHNISTQSRRFLLGTPVSHTDQAMAWIIAVVSFILPFLSSRRLICRLMVINTSLLNFYLLLSVCHEGLFLFTLIFNVTCWIIMEFKLLALEKVKITELSLEIDSFEKPSQNLTTIERSISKEDFRRAFFFITYIIVAFFGTGNIASINSFEVRWVTCFITSFKPFIITGLVLLKTITPFLIVACSFRAVQHITKAPVGCLNIIVLIYSNIMGIELLFYVKNIGSWLQIGTSISQFVIVQMITLFIVLLNQVAKVMTVVNICNYASEVFKSRKKYV